jgi:hypothetical protein
MRIGIVGLMVVIVGGAQLAYGGEPWGTAEDAGACEKDYVAHKNWRRHAKSINEALKAEQVSAPCKAEIEKRAKQCADDPEIQKVIKDPAYKVEDAAGYCNYRAFNGMAVQLDAVLEKKAKDADAAQQAAAAEAAVAKAELPKAKGTNAALEKMIRAEIKENWKDGEKLLKIIFDSGTDWEIKRNGLGIITGRQVAASAVYKKDDKCFVYQTYWVQQYNGKTYAGPLEEHGGGGAQKFGILCEKVK